MTPEQKARQQIDLLLTQAGWVVQDYADMNLQAGLGVAVREFPLSTGAADYLLYADEKALGVVEAKPEGHTLKGVETQSAKYLDGLPKAVPAHALPLPFAYESTGVVTQFTNRLEPDAASREVFAFHQPQELLRLVGLDAQVRTRLRQMPPLEQGKLWSVQADAIRGLEKSLSENRPRSLIQMATGSGKTFTAVNACYRLAKYAGAKRILFLVDRTNLGRQTLTEFQQFATPSGFKFTDEYTVTHLRKNAIPVAAKVVITTIQRLFSMLKGDDDYLEENEEGSLYEAEGALPKKPVEVAYNPRFPVEAFDFIVVDECHRSIYNLWRQVLDYFDAFLVGLTATPTAQTLGFFNQNLVQDYSHEKAVADGVNVGYDVYRIETQVTKNGVTLLKQPGVFVPHRDRRTKAKKLKELDADLTFTATQLDRDVVAPDQIRLVVKTFKDRLPEIFPGRTEVPKTLIFAKTDLHAEDIVKQVREEFGKGNDFCQKITSKTTGKKPEDLLADFRNSYFPRVAVTVDMIATGTDVRPLECLVFLRNVKSLAYFEQMKGRGCRVIDPDSLRSVTPDAVAKTHFVIVDAVGVCEDDKQATKPLDRKPYVPLATGDLTADWRAAHAHAEPATKLLDRILAERRRKWEDDQKAKFAASGKTPPNSWQAKYEEPAQVEAAPEDKLPRSWCWASIDQLAVVVRGASPRPAGDPRFFGGGHTPWITVGSLTADEGIYLRSVSESLTEAGRDASRYIEPQTLLLTNSGATLGVPKITLIGGCINDGSVALLDVPYPLKLYLHFYLKSQTKRLRSINQGAAQPNLNTGIVKSLVVPVPPVAEQEVINQEVERRLSVITASEDYIAASLKRADRLRQSILKEAFAGRLVPQDPADEPASVLLDRIREARASGRQGVSSSTRSRRPRARPAPDDDGSTE